MSYIGKYFNVNIIHHIHKTLSYIALYKCIDIINENNQTFFIMNGQSGEVIKVKPENIINEVVQTAQPKYSIGQSVSAVVEYARNEPIENYCKITGVNMFCNNISYNVSTIRDNKEYIVSESSIKKIAVLSTAKFSIGQRVSVKIVLGGGLDHTVENGVITKVNLWFDYVSYEVRLDNGKIESTYEGAIGKPYTPPPPVDMKILLKQREAQLIADLESIRQHLSSM